jgi:HEAT repeat protein
VSKLQSHIHALERGNAGTHRETIDALKHYQEHEWAAAAPKLIQALVASLGKQLKSEGTQPFLRREIVLILGSMGPRSAAAIPQLTDLLHDSVPHALREAAASTLGKIASTAHGAVDQLIRLLSADRPALVMEGVRALGSIGKDDEKVSAALLDLWAAPTSAILHLEVAFALCKLRIEATGLRGVLTHTLVTSPEAALRKAAARALAWCKKTDPDVAPALLTAALKEKDDEVGQIAEAGLCQLGLSHDKARELCAQQLGSSAIAEAALRQSGPLAVPCLREALATHEPGIRERAVRILGSLGEAASDAVPDLTPLLLDNSLEVRLAAAKGLWNITKNAELVVPVLVALLRHKQTFARDAGEVRRRFLQTVIEALQRIGPAATKAIPALTEKTRDENRSVSDSARAALKEIAPSLEPGPCKRGC